MTHDFQLPLDSENNFVFFRNNAVCLKNVCVIDIGQREQLMDLMVNISWKIIKGRQPCMNIVN
jgi:hypothetical protein